MTLKTELLAEANKTLTARWNEQVTTNIPVPEDLLLNSNHAKHLESATVLYADLDGSTNMVDNYNWAFSAEIYKIYLKSAAKIIRAEGGTITAYDGDRIMAVFIGNSKNTSAVTAALKINYAVQNILRPAINDQYPKTTFTLNHTIGIDTSSLHASRIGVRGDNDIVWVGKAANYAAKLCSESARPIWITKSVYDNIHESVKLSTTSMWQSFKWGTMNNLEIYGTTYHWTFE